MTNDIVVLGAGVVGLSTARWAAEKGARVTVVEPKQPGGQGSRAAAGVAVASVRLLDDPQMLEFTRDSMPKLATELEGLSTWGALRRGGGILRVAADPKMRELLEAKSKTVPTWLGRWVDGKDLPGLEPALEGTPLLGGFLSDEGFMVDTGAYLNALQAVAAKLKVTLRFGEAAVSVSETASGVEILTDRGTLKADQLVVAAGAWSGRFGGLPPLPVMPMRGQMMTVGHPSLRLTRVVSGSMYLGPWRSGELVVGATEEDAGFAPQVTSTGLLQLTAALAKMAPAMREAPVTSFWAGLRAATPSGRPFIGRWPGQQRVWIAAGHGGQGILTGSATGAAVASLLDGQRVPQVELFDPARHQ
ncbi:MAG: FAD-binding oxidoreductase [Myxococcaceae bacterium]|nr:FAD-binding oxidoreductase [Myxococcaceae bacterium]